MPEVRIQASGLLALQELAYRVLVDPAVTDRWRKFDPV
jgi:hypothetical protein